MPHTMPMLPRKSEEVLDWLNSKEIDNAEVMLLLVFSPSVHEASFVEECAIRKRIKAVVVGALTKDCDHIFESTYIEKGDTVVVSMASIALLSSSKPKGDIDTFLEQSIESFELFRQSPDA